MKRSSRLRGKVLRTNALVSRMSRSLMRLSEAVPVTESDDAFVAEVLTCNATAAHLDKDAIRVSRRTLKQDRHREVDALVTAPHGTPRALGQAAQAKKPSTPTPTPTPTQASPTTPAAPTPTPPPSRTGPDERPRLGHQEREQRPAVVCPAGTFTGDVRVPSGVTVVGQGMDKTRIVGSLTWGSGTTVRDLAVGGGAARTSPRSTRPPTPASNASASTAAASAVGSSAGTTAP